MPQTAQGNQYIVVFVDWQSGLRCIPQPIRRVRPSLDLWSTASFVGMVCLLNSLIVEPIYCHPWWWTCAALGHENGEYHCQSPSDWWPCWECESHNSRNDCTSSRMTGTGTFNSYCLLTTSSPMTPPVNLPFSSCMGEMHVVLRKPGMSGGAMDNPVSSINVKVSLLWITTNGVTRHIHGPSMNGHLDYSLNLTVHGRIHGTTLPGLL